MSGYEIPTKARSTVNRRSLGYCERCGSRGAEVHHRKRGNPRLHWIQNLVRLCRACHEWATMSPGQAEGTGWVLTGTVTPLGAALAPLALLGRVWVSLTPAGEYVLGSVLLDNISEVPPAELARAARAAGFHDVVRAPIVSRLTYDHGLGERDELLGVTHEVRQVDIPAHLFYKPSETVFDYFARSQQVRESVYRVSKDIEPLDE